MCRADCGTSDAEKNAAKEIIMECGWQEQQVLREVSKLAGVTADEVAQSIAEFEMWANAAARRILWWLAVDPKWEHLAVHAKKLRTRKKYKRKIKQIFDTQIEPRITIYEPIPLERTLEQCGK